MEMGSLRQDEMRPLGRPVWPLAIACGQTEELSLNFLPRLGILVRGPSDHWGGLQTVYSSDYPIALLQGSALGNVLILRSKVSSTRLFGVCRLSTKVRKATKPLRS